jgi:hypothetical protein
MANSIEFSVPPSGVFSCADTHAMKHSMPPYQSMILIQGEEELSSPSGFAVTVTTERSESSNAHQLPMTEQNLQFLPEATSLVGSVVPSVDLVQRYETAKAAYEAALARQEIILTEAILAQEAENRSLAGSEECHSDDSYSDTESLGPSLFCTAQEYPIRGLHLLAAAYYYSYSDDLRGYWGTYVQCHRLRVHDKRAHGAIWGRYQLGTEINSSRSVLACGAHGAIWGALRRGPDFHIVRPLRNPRGPPRPSRRIGRPRKCHIINHRRGGPSVGRM